MASSKALLFSRAVEKIVLPQTVIQACNRVKMDVFATNPQLNIRTGYQLSKIPYTGEYWAPERYFHASIDPIARKYFPGYMTEEEERRQLKLARNKRRGLGPPKKGLGKRAQKKQQRAKKTAAPPK